MAEPIFSLAQKKKTLLAAHRGVSGGNIPCNSKPAFELALSFGADIVELDVEQSSDGVLFIQHPGKELNHLRFADSLRNYPAEFIEKMYLGNIDWTPTQYPILRFEEALALLQGRCFINIDKFWGAPDRIAAAVRERGMQDQVIIKTKPTEDRFQMVEEFAWDLPYMPMVREQQLDFLPLLKRKMRFAGIEAIFRTEDAPVADAAYRQSLHEHGCIVFSDAIVYDYKKVLSAGHDDDRSLTDCPENGWGWLADQGFDVIQTDWLLPCERFLRETGRRI